MTEQVNNAQVSSPFTEADREMMLKALAQQEIERRRQWHEQATKAEDAIVVITYTNHRDETRDRTIIPVHLWYGKTAWHPVNQWMLDAVDLEKQATRSFAIKDIQNWNPTVPKE